MDANIINDFQPEFLETQPSSDIHEIPIRSLQEWADVQFNTWNYSYWVLGLGCNDQRILNVLLFHWPLMLDLGDGEENRKLHMHHLADYLHDILYTMHEAEDEVEHDIAQQGESKTASFINIEKQQTLQFYWWIATGWLFISVETAISMQTHSTYSLDFIFHDTRSPRYEDTGIPLSIMVTREVRTIDEMQVGTFVQEELFSEPLLFFQYRMQIRRLMTRWMALTPEYWNNKGPLPELLEI
jgi:hypothetical protein